MKALEHHWGEARADAAAWTGHSTPALRPDYLYLVTAQEVAELRLCLRRGQVPPDLETKLARLAEGDLTGRFVARNSQLFITLLQAAEAGLFTDASSPQCERLLRVVAYVRKDDDAVADYQPGGFKDDQGEIRAVLLENSALLKSFKAWHLAQQVPRLWRHSQPSSAASRS